MAADALKSMLMERLHSDNIPVPAVDSDHDLMTRIRFGDQQAYAALLTRYWSVLVPYAENQLGSSDGAEDIVQEAFIRLWEGRQKWVARGSARAYLYTVVRNLCSHERDRGAVRGRWAAQEGRIPRLAESPEDVFRNREIHEAFLDAMGQLPEKRREVFVLVFLHGLSYAEVGTTLGISVSTVGNQMSAALRAMRAALRCYSDGPA